MYNVRLFKYPSGWQYRIYNDIVGFHDSNTKTSDDSNVQEVLYWDYGIGDWSTAICDPDTMWHNPFSLEYEKAPTLYHEPDTERSAKVSMSRTVSRVYHLARSNVWDWFFTLTFDPAKVDSFDYGACTKKLSQWLKDMRKLSPELRYLVVPEKHKSGRFHFHGLFAGCDGISFRESGHCTKDGDVMIYNIGNYHLGFSTATKIKDNSRVVKYISKYITKDLCAVTSGKKRYWASRNLADLEAEEAILEPQEMAALLSRLNEDCLHRKAVGSGDTSVVYYEMGVEYENS